MGGSVVCSSLAEVQKFLNDISWGPSAPLKVVYGADDGEPYGARIVARVEVPERELGQVTVPVYVMQHVMLPVRANELLRCAELLAKELYIHEMQEAFMVRGIRVLDPHKDGR